MDPNATLFRMMTLATQITTTLDDGEIIDVNDTAELTELVTALDNWIRRGGFLPTAWERKGK